MRMRHTNHFERPSQTDKWISVLAIAGPALLVIIFFKVANLILGGN